MAPDHDHDNESALAALLEYIADERERQREAILGTARGDADAIVRDALAQARGRVREAIERARRERRERLQAARAASATRLRERRQEITRTRLDEAWSILERTLADRWAHAAGRREWLTGALAVAARHLPAGTWRLAHPADLDPGEARAAFAAVSEDRPDVEIECVQEDALDGGIRIHVANAVLDVTMQALLAERARVEGLLLGALAQQGAEIAGAATPQRAGEQQ